MKPLLKNQQVLKWLCVFPLDETINKWEKCFYHAFSMFVFIINVFGAFAGIAFFSKFVTIDLGSSLYSLFNIFGTIYTAYTTFVALLCHKKVAAIFQSLSVIYKQSKIRINIFLKSLLSEFN